MDEEPYPSNQILFDLIVDKKNEFKFMNELLQYTPSEVHFFLTKKENCFSFVIFTKDDFADQTLLEKVKCELEGILKKVENEKSLWSFWWGD